MSAAAPGGGVRETTSGGRLLAFAAQGAGRRTITCFGKKAHPRERRTVGQLSALHPRWSAESVREKHRALSLWDPETTAIVREYPGTRAVPPAVPSLVVIGDVQPVIGDTLADQLRSEGYEVRVVPGAGHNVHNDEPGAFWNALDGWLWSGGDHPAGPCPCPYACGGGSGTACRMSPGGSVSLSPSGRRPR